MNHECIYKFETEKIDDCSGEGYNICYGLSPMTLEVWFCDTDGHEERCDNWKEIKVNFCPYCGMEEKSGVKVNYESMD